MAREEEEKEEAMCLTYDRPEMINKVVFRRNKSTGTWEVFVPNASPPGKASQSNVVSKIDKNVGKKYKSEINGPVPPPLTRVSPRLNLSENNKVHEIESHDCHTPLSRSNRGRSAVLPRKWEDPDYSPESINRIQVASCLPRTSLDNHKETVSPLSVDDGSMVLRSRVPAINSPPVHGNSGVNVSLSNHFDVKTSPNHNINKR